MGPAPSAVGVLGGRSSQDGLSKEAMWRGWDLCASCGTAWERGRCWMCVCTMEDTAGYFAPRPCHSQVMESLGASSHQTHEGAEEVDERQGPDVPLLHRGPKSKWGDWECFWNRVTALWLSPVCSDLKSGKEQPSWEHKVLSLMPYSPVTTCSDLIDSLPGVSSPTSLGPVPLLISCAMHFIVCYYAGHC